MNQQSTIVRAFTAGMLAAAILLGAQANRPAAWADTTAQAQVSQVNQSPAGARTGILTRAKGSLVQIDRTNYVLAAQAVLKDTYGNFLEPADLVYEGVELSVQFWLGTGETQNQIIQMILTFAE